MAAMFGSSARLLFSRVQIYGHTSQYLETITSQMKFTATEQNALFSIALKGILNGTTRRHKKGHGQAGSSFCRFKHSCRHIPRCWIVKDCLLLIPWILWGWSSNQRAQRVGSIQDWDFWKLHLLKSSFSFRGRT
jgi:hypothetical protein